MASVTARVRARMCCRPEARGGHRSRRGERIRDCRTQKISPQIRKDRTPRRERPPRLGRTEIIIFLSNRLRGEEVAWRSGLGGGDHGRKQRWELTRCDQATGGLAVGMNLGPPRDSWSASAPPSSVRGNIDSIVALTLEILLAPGGGVAVVEGGVGGWDEPAEEVVVGTGDETVTAGRSARAPPALPPVAGSRWARVERAGIGAGARTIWVVEPSPASLLPPSSCIAVSSPSSASTSASSSSSSPPPPASTLRNLRALASSSAQAWSGDAAFFSSSSSTCLVLGVGGSSPSCHVRVFGLSSAICSHPTGGEPGGEMRKLRPEEGTVRCWSTALAKFEPAALPA